MQSNNNNLNAGVKVKDKLNRGVWRNIAPLLVSAWFTLLLNQAFFERLTKIYAWTENAGFIAYVAGLLVVLLALLLAILQIKKLWAWLWGGLLLLAAGFANYMDSYGVVLDATMWLNVAQTQSQEALDLLSLKMLGYFFGFTVLPLITALYIQKKWMMVAEKKTSTIGARRGLHSYFKRLGGYSLLLALMIVIGLGFFGKNLGSFFREHKELRYYTNPLGPLQGLGKFAMNSLRSVQTGEKSITVLDPDASMGQKQSKPKLLLLVVGETARVANIGINGYARQTTPLLQQQPVVSYVDTESCGTSTAISVPCMFYPYGQDRFSLEEFGKTENAVDMLARLGVKVLWRDNNSSSKGVAERPESAIYQNYRDDKLNPLCDDECRDEGMLQGLETWMSENVGRDKLIILHQMGSHGPAYYKRYPKEFERFTPVCKTAQLEQCSQEEVVNTYDNTILYTDHFLTKSLDWLRGNSQDYDIAWLYVSDHGESLGEKGIYLHGLPKWIAPRGQTTPAMMSWRPEQDKNTPWAAQTSKKKVSHDDLFHTLLGFYGVQSQVYKQERDWWAANE